MQTTIASEISTIPSSLPDTVDASFASAIEAAGVLTAPSADEIALATDANLYMPNSGRAPARPGWGGRAPSAGPSNGQRRSGR